MLDTLAVADVKAVFYVSGILAELYPPLMKAIVAARHHISAHSWGQNIVPAYQTRDEEKADLLKCINAIEQSPTGAPAAGSAHAASQASARPSCWPRQVLLGMATSLTATCPTRSRLRPTH
ncbi:polysaccharide deacetylase family protein [Tardiphaga sp. vice304]|uniref:polysaccharide deacetylase family protein n=1 Tax=Tardiphaga sp. vice304 TaxID=2592817 RepID=UPI00116329AE|nr:polysaccharide deacetylase family protein [Tardiphaga sp. vice304]